MSPAEFRDMVQSISPDEASRKLDELQVVEREFRDARLLANKKLGLIVGPGAHWTDYANYEDGFEKRSKEEIKKD